MLLGLYRLATDLGAPLWTLHLNQRVRRGKEQRQRLGERAGRATVPRPDGPLLWVHAASVGEALTVLPLIETLLDERSALHVLMTTGTITSAELMAERLPERAFHQFAPLDRAAAWRDFFANWRPSLGCLVESEIWPHLILEAERAGLPLALINGRMSERSARRWRWAGGAGRRLFGGFALCLARGQTDAVRLAALGAKDVRTLGDLKNATPPLPADPETLLDLQEAVGDRPVWLAASTHPGEEIDILAAHQRLRRSHPALLTMIAPRHPERGERIADELRDRSATTVARRSLGEPLDRTTDLYLADTLGELGLFYRLARLAFIGGSLVPAGGHNPLEAARLGCPPVFGPHTGNFAEMTEDLLERGAAKRIVDADDLAQTIDALLADPAKRDRMATVGIEAGLAGTAILGRVRQALSPLLDRRHDDVAMREARHACA